MLHGDLHLVCESTCDDAIKSGQLRRLRPCVSRWLNMHRWCVHSRMCEPGVPGWSRVFASPLDLRGAQLYFAAKRRPLLSAGHGAERPKHGHRQWHLLQWCVRRLVARQPQLRRMWNRLLSRDAMQLPRWHHGRGCLSSHVVLSQRWACVRVQPRSRMEWISDPPPGVQWQTHQPTPLCCAALAACNRVPDYGQSGRNTHPGISTATAPFPSPRGPRLFVSNEASGDLSVMDVATNTGGRPRRGDLAGFPLKRAPYRVRSRLRRGPSE